MLDNIINEHYHILTPTDFDILGYIMANKKEVSEMSVQELADKSYVSSASIVRFAKKIGLNGFSELKYQLKSELTQTSENFESSVSLLKNDIEDTINLLSEQNLEPLIHKIKKSNKIFCYGTDWGEKLSTEFLIRNFISNHIFMNTIPSMTEMYWTIDKLTSNDLMIILSFSGESEELRKVVTQLKTRNIPVLSITPLSGNFLSSEATYRLYYQSTHLDTVAHPETEYNFFTSLNVLIDFLFRSYHDYYYSQNT